MRIEDLTNYEIVEHRFLDDVHSDSYLLKHKKTGAMVALMPNDDNNKVFYIAFRTIPKDSTGVPHIIEHTVLCGSDKYPVKDPFVELCKGSLNTFLNAMTYPDKTVYPVASCNEADFKNLMDVYLDAVFHPNIYKEKKIFEQEGWHYDLNDADDELKYNGVVYSEMKGAFSDPDDIIDRTIMNSIMPDTTYGVESGGDPDNIPELTYEKFLEFHSTFYHPSNSYIFLYGNTDMAEKLDYIDKEYLSHYDYLKVDSEIAMQKPFDEGREVTVEYPLTENEDDEDKTYLTLSYVCGDYKDKELPVVLRAFEYAFSGNPAAPLRKKLLEAGIGDEVYASADSSIIQNSFGFYAKGANPSDKDKFLLIIKEEIERTVKEGFDKKTILAFLTREEFKFREADFGRYPKGLVYGLDLLDSWLYDPYMAFYHVEMLDTYKFLKEAVNTDYYEQILKKYFVDNNHFLVCTGLPKKGLTVEKDNKLKEKLAKLKASMSKEEIDAIVDETKKLREYQEAPDRQEDLEKIKLLSIKDIDVKTRPSRNFEDKLDDMIFIKQDIYTSGIAYLTLYFNTKGLDEYHFKYLSVLTQLLCKMNTKNMAYGDVSNDIKLYTGGMLPTMTYRKKYDTCEIDGFIEVNVKFLYENKGKVFELLKEILLTSDFSDKKKLKEYISEMRSQAESMLISTPHVVAVTRANSYFDEFYKMVDDSTGIECVRLLQKLDDNFEEEVDKLIEELNFLTHSVFRKENMCTNLISPKEMSHFIDEELIDFRKNLFTDEVEKFDFGFELNKGNEAFLFPGQVQYVAYSGEYRSKGLKYTGAFNVLKVILAYDYLWTQVRVKGGAYGCFANFAINGNCTLVSFRDPHLNNTLDVFRNLTDYLENFDCTDRQLNQFIIGAIADLDQPMTPSVEGKLNASEYFLGITEEIRQTIRNEVLSCTKEDIKALAKHIKASFEKEYICTVGSEAKINANSEIFDSIKNLV